MRSPRDNKNPIVFLTFDPEAAAPMTHEMEKRSNIKVINVDRTKHNKEVIRCSGVISSILDVAHRSGDERTEQNKMKSGVRWSETS